MTSRRLFAFIAISVLAIGLSAFFVTRNTRREVHVNSAPAPGFDGSARKVDNSRFQLAGPTTTAGPTTIPGADRRFRPRPNASTTTSTTASTTTTTMPTSIQLASNITDICGLWNSVKSFALMFTDPSVNVEQDTLRLVENMSRYVEVSPADIRAYVVDLRNAILEYRAALSAAHWNPHDPRVQDLKRSVEEERPPLANLVKDGNVIQLKEAELCHG